MEQILASPYHLTGSDEGTVERLHELRVRFNVSYIAVMPEDADTFAPVVTRPQGT